MQITHTKNMKNGLIGRLKNPFPTSEGTFILLNFCAVVLFRSCFVAANLNQLGKRFWKVAGNHWKQMMVLCPTYFATVLCKKN